MPFQSHTSHRTYTWHVPLPHCMVLLVSRTCTLQYMSVMFVHRFFLGFVLFLFGSFGLSLHLIFAFQKNCIGDIVIQIISCRPVLFCWWVGRFDEISLFLFSCNNLLSSFQRIYKLFNCEVRIDLFNNRICSEVFNLVETFWPSFHCCCVETTTVSLSF